MSNDSDIIRTLQEDPRKGFTTLMRQFQEPVYWHIRRIVVCHDDAQDATQETFVRVFRSLDDIGQVQSLKAWIYRIATNEALRVIDQREQDTVSLDDPEESIFQRYADDYVDFHRDAEVLLQKAILSLPQKQQLAFNLRYYDELSYSEIGDICGTTLVGAKMNYHLAKDKIVKYIKSHQK